MKKYPSNTYALKGMELSLHTLGKSEEGIDYLVRAAEKSTPEDMDAYSDLSVVYDELGRTSEAIKILDAAEGRLPGFKSRIYPFYNQLLRKNAMS